MGTWRVTEGNKRMFEAIEMDVMRRADITSRQVRKENIRNKMASTQRKQLNLFGHVQRMADHRFDQMDTTS